MIYILHGEDIVSSRNSLNKILESMQDITRIDGKKESLEAVSNALSSSSLFSDKKTLVVKFFTKIKPQKDFMELVSRFESEANTEIILWDESEIKSKSTFDALNKAKVQVFSYPKMYYTFLDSYAPAPTRSFELLHEVLKTFEAEQVLYGLIRRLRHLLVLKAANYSEFSEFKNMQSWQLERLKKQADIWREEDLKKVFVELLALDEKIKTSALTMNLAQHLDIILLSHLN